MLQTLGSVPTERSPDTNETVGSREGSPLEEEEEEVGEDQLLYHVSQANQEYLAFSLCSHKWKASTAESNPGSWDCLTATMTKKET